MDEKTHITKQDSVLNESGFDLKVKDLFIRTQKD